MNYNIKQNRKILNIKLYPLLFVIYLTSFAPSFLITIAYFEIQLNSEEVSNRMCFDFEQMNNWLIFFRFFRFPDMYFILSFAIFISIVYTIHLLVIFTIIIFIIVVSSVRVTPYLFNLLIILKMFIVFDSVLSFFIDLIVIFYFIILVHSVELRIFQILLRTLR